MTIRVIHVVLIITAWITNTDSVNNVMHTPLMSAAIPPESSPVVSAVLLECPKMPRYSTENAEQRPRPRPTHGEQQLMINIRVNPSFHIEKVEKFLILDEVYDTQKSSKARIMAPYLIEISRGEPVMMYPLEFTKSVKIDPGPTTNTSTSTSSSQSSSTSSGQSSSTSSGPSSNTSTSPSSSSSSSPSSGADSSQSSVTTPCPPSVSNTDAGSGPSSSTTSPPPPIESSNATTAQNKTEKNGGKPNPQQESFDRVISKIAGSISPGTKIRNNLNGRKVYRHEPYLDLTQAKSYHENKLPKNMVLVQDSAYRGNEKKHRRNQKSRSDHKDKKQIQRKAVQSRRTHSRADPRIKIAYVTSDIRPIEGDYNEANVGLEKNLANQLEIQAATSQAGFAEPSAGTYQSFDRVEMKMPENNYGQLQPLRAESNEDKHSTRKKSIDMRVAANQPHQHIANLIYEEDDGDTEEMADLNGSFAPQEHESETEIAGRDNADEFSGEVNPINYMQRLNVKPRHAHVHAKKRRKGRKRAKLTSFRRDPTKNRLMEVRPEHGKNSYNDDDGESEEMGRNKEPMRMMENPYMRDHFKSCQCRNNFLRDREHEHEPESDDIESKETMNPGYGAPGDAQNERQLNGKSQVTRERPQKWNSDDATDSDEIVDYEESHAEIADKLKGDQQKRYQYLLAARRQAEPFTDLNIPSIENLSTSNLLTLGYMQPAKIQPLQLDMYDDLHSSDWDDYEDPSSKIDTPTIVNKRYNKNERNAGYLQLRAIQIARSNANGHRKPGKYISKITAKHRFDDPFKSIDKSYIFDSPPRAKSHKGSQEKSNNRISAAASKQKGESEIEYKSLWDMPNSGLQMAGTITFPNSFYTEAPLSEFYRNLPSNPAPTFIETLNREHAKYLPKHPPYSTVLDDPNLNLNDKMHVLDVVDPYNENTDEKLRELTNELDHSFMLKPYPMPIPVPVAPVSLHKRKTADSSANKKKRSFLFYDDLEMRDTLNDNDYNFDSFEHKPYSKLNAPRHLDDDAQPCSSCGGKSKKPAGKTDSVATLRGLNRCECRSQSPHRSCSCETTKARRSVSDTWYSVFNMSAPLPFLTTKIRIFQKRRNIWWKIAPSITLSSLSGIFANANLSILFSSHVDIFQLEKSLRLQNHQLLIPKDDSPFHSNKLWSKLSKKSHPKHELLNLIELNMNPSSILAIDSNKFSLDSQTNVVDEPEANSESRVSFVADAKISDMKNSKRAITKNDIHTIADLGYFPASMNLLERCPNDNSRLCLNMLEDKVPAYSIKVKMPFRENAVFVPNHFMIKITRIVTDATTKDALQVSVEIINEGIEAHEFSVKIGNCAFPCATQSVVKKVLIPHISETLTFLLPLITDTERIQNQKFTCEVLVQTKNDKHPLVLQSVLKAQGTSGINVNKLKDIAVRQMIVSPGNRCFCVWECSCHCIPKLESHVDFHMCQLLQRSEERRAGLLIYQRPGCTDVDIDDDNEMVGSSRKEDQSESNGICDFIRYALIILLIMLLLGLLKAIFGLCCCKSIDRCGFDYIHPGSYDDISGCRRFFVNIVFFVVFPFLFWCKCFTPSEEDLMVASTEWQCDNMCCASGSHEEVIDGDYECVCECDDEEGEDVILTQHIDRTYDRPTSSQSQSKSGKLKPRLSGGQEIFDMEARLKDLTLAFHEGVFDDEDDDDDEEVNTKFILQALVESRESLKKLLRDHSSVPNISTAETCNSEVLRQADELVCSLKSAQIVYRLFNRPLGNMRGMPDGCKYCIQGYFLPAIGAEYEFVNYNPLAQHRCVSPNGRYLDVIRPPIILCPKEFSRTYASKLEVLEAGDLFVQPPNDVPCINVSALASVASSVARLTSDRSYYSPLGYRATSPDSFRSGIHFQSYLLPTENERPSDFPAAFDLDNQALLEDESLTMVEEVTSSPPEDDDVVCESLQIQPLIREYSAKDVERFKCETIFE